MARGGGRRPPAKEKWDRIWLFEEENHGGLILNLKWMRGIEVSWKGGGGVVVGKGGVAGKVRIGDLQSQTTKKIKIKEIKRNKTKE